METDPRHAAPLAAVEPIEPARLAEQAKRIAAEQAAAPKSDAAPDAPAQLVRPREEVTADLGRALRSLVLVWYVFHRPRVAVAADVDKALRIGHALARTVVGLFTRAGLRPVPRALDTLALWSGYIADGAHELLIDLLSATPAPKLPNNQPSKGAVACTPPLSH
mgnify:CR=1 FL=1